MHHRPVTVYIGSYQVDLGDLCTRHSEYIVIKMQKSSVSSGSLSKTENSSAALINYIRKLYRNTQAFNLPILVSSNRKQFANSSISDMDFLPCMALLRSQKCADDRDKVFAVLGMTPYKFRDQILVDYRLTKRDVYTSAMKQILSNQNLTSLLQVQSPDRPITSLGLPSWVPDWTTEQDYFSKTTMFANIPGCFRQSLREIPEVRYPLLRPDSLILSGIYIGAVQTVSCIELSVNNKFPPTKFTRMKLFTYNRDVPASNNSSEIRLLAPPTLTKVETNTLVPAEAMLTQSWGPPKTEPEDIIIISPMCSVPLVLRRVSAVSYLLVGGCFLVASKLDRGEDENVNILNDPGFSTIMHGSAWDESKVQDYYID